MTAPCAASLEIAASLANRFGVIVGRRKWVHQMNATVRDNGMADRLSGFYAVELGVNDFQTDHDARAALTMPVDTTLRRPGTARPSENHVRHGQRRSN